MPANITVSHASPLLNYIPRSAWMLVVGGEDGLFDERMQHVTHGHSAGIWVYGISLADSGPYQVVLDNDAQVFDVYPGEAPQPGDPALLFGASDLPLDQHEIRVVNTGSIAGAATLAVEYVRSHTLRHNEPCRAMDTNEDWAQLVFESQLRTNATIEHTSNLCTWAPPTSNAWQADDTSHVTVDGHTDPPYIPNVAPGIGSLNSSFAVNQSAPVLLYANMNLRQGVHTVLLENNPISDWATLMSISYGVVFADDSATSSGGSTPTESTSPDLKSKRNKILFSSGFGFLGLLLLAIATWRLLIIYRRRTASRADEVTARPFLAPSTSTPPPSTTTFGAPTASPANAQEPTSPGMVYAGRGSRAHYVMLPPREKEVLSPTFAGGSRRAGPAVVQTRLQPLRRAPESPGRPMTEEAAPQAPVRETTSPRRSAFHSLAVAAADRERERAAEGQTASPVPERGEAKSTEPSGSDTAQPRPPENRARILARRQAVLGAGQQGASSAFSARARPPRTPPELRLGATDPAGGWIWDMQMPPPYRTIDMH
ncbi:hypothetical protein ACG7TL_008001 [Trametes sanguinea]